MTIKKKSSVNGPKRKMDRAKKQVSEPTYWTHERNAEQRTESERGCVKRGKKDKSQVLPALWQEVQKSNRKAKEIVEGHFQR